MNFVLWHDGTELGPYELAAVREALRAGDISPKTLAKVDGTTEWKPLCLLLPAKETEAPLREITASHPGGSRNPFLWMGGVVAGVVLSAAFLLLSGLPREGEVSGLVYSLSPDGTALNQAEAKVSILDAADFSSKVVEGLKDYAEGNLPKEIELPTNSPEKLKRLALLACVFKKMPKPVAERQTDAGGKFSAVVPRKGSYVVIAQTSRLASNGTETMRVYSTSFNFQKSKHISVELGESNVWAETLPNGEVSGNLFKTDLFK